MALAASYPEAEKAFMLAARRAAEARAAIEAVNGALPEGELPLTVPAAIAAETVVDRDSPVR